MDKGHAKLSIRGFHERRRKGARLHFDCCKNHECHWQLENVLPNMLTSNTGNSGRADSSNEQQHKSLSLEVMKPALISISLTHQWQAIPSTDNVQYCKMNTDLNGLYKVTTSIIVHADLSWSVYTDDKEVPATCTCSILTSYTRVISSPDVVAHDRRVSSRDLSQ